MKLDTSPEALAEELLGRAFDQLDPDERAVLHRVSTGEITGLDADERAAANLSFGDRLADKVALPAVEPGDLIAIFLAGAYGASASPARIWRAASKSGPPCGASRESCATGMSASGSATIIGTKTP